MSFFDNKEEVLDIELTQYGRQLLYAGKFKPTYYSFHDEGVVYDITNASDADELQISSSIRILEQSIYSKPQRKQELFNKPLTNNNTIQNLLGNSSLIKDNPPSWSISLLKGEINNFQEKYKNTSQIQQQDLNPVYYNLDIPQINLKNIESEIKFLGVNDVKDGTEIFFQDGNSVAIKNNYVLLDISEINADFEGEAFEIEIFEINGQETDGSDILKQIFFKKPQEFVINDILYDESELPEQIIDENLEYADNYFNLLVDDEIDLETVSNEIGTVIIPKIVKPPFGENC